MGSPYLLLSTIRMAIAAARSSNAQVRMIGDGLGAVAVSRSGL
ncbi:hypothetical protein [Amycolatopsis coloradensis]|nr:hypothetical protein [Amycolatopsis coloradensis]